MLLFSNYYSIHVVFVLHRLAVVFAFETEDGCRASETSISDRVLLFEDYFWPAVTPFYVMFKSSI